MFGIFSLLAGLRQMKIMKTYIKETALKGQSFYFASIKVHCFMKKKIKIQHVFLMCYLCLKLINGKNTTYFIP